MTSCSSAPDETPAAGFGLVGDIRSAHWIDYDRDGLLDLHDTDVASIMTPRIDLVAFGADVTLHDASELIMQSGYSRFPVIRESIDDICGILYARDLLKCMSDGADVHSLDREGRRPGQLSNMGVVSLVGTLLPKSGEE